MPAIHLFQKRTLYGGDDLHLLALMTASVRCFQLLCYGVLTYHIVQNIQTSDTYWGELGGDLSGSQQDTTNNERKLLLTDSDVQEYSGVTTTTTTRLLEYAWMDATDQSASGSSSGCDNSHLFPLFLMTYTAAGIVFDVATLCLIYQIYQTSSIGCPTLQRHPRTETMEQYLEWMFFPINLIHACIWTTGLIAMGLAVWYSSCEDYNVSTWFKVIWILCGLSCILSQGVEILWNIAYVIHLVYRDPHALLWAPRGDTTSQNNIETALRIAHHNHELVEEMWAERLHNGCRCLGAGTCYMFGGRELYGSGAMHYGDVARALADYLETRGVLDVVPSDLIVGFLVLQQLQTQRRYQQRQHVLVEHSRQSLYSSNGNSINPTISSNEQSPQQQQNLARSNVTTPNGMQLIQRSSSLDVDGNGSSSMSMNNTVSTPQTPLQPRGLPLAAHSSAISSLPRQPPPAASTNSTGEEQSSSSLLEDESRKGFQRVLSSHNHADMHLLHDGARYSKYALAIYTWYLYVYVHPVTGIPRLCAKALKDGCRCCFCHHQDNNSGGNTTNSGFPTTRSPSNASLHSADNMSNPPPPHRHRYRQKLDGDNVCEAHKNALLLTAGIDEADLVYVQLRSSLAENPYCILLDHETQVVIVAVRGTFSLEDCVNDVLLEPESLEALGDEYGFSELAKGQHCHGGVLACARNVYRDLQRHGYLEYLLESQYPHYQLRLVGHSLGAACSTILGFMLRQTYPSLKCFNYSPPGCTLTWDAAVACQPWTTSFVLDSELVPRLTFEALEHLRNEVLELIGRVQVPKVEVARRVATNALWCSRRGRPRTRTRTVTDYDLEEASASIDELDELLQDLLLPADQLRDTSTSSYRQQLEQFQTVQSERRLARGERRATRLFPPGRMLHLVKTDEESTCFIQMAKVLTCCTTNAGSQYTPVWINNGDLHEIVVSPTMGTDHFPNRMVEELEGIAEDFGLTLSSGLSSV